MTSPADRRLRGCAEIGVALLILGTSATFVQISPMPASLLVALRMGLAGLALLVLAGVLIVALGKSAAGQPLIEPLA